MRKETQKRSSRLLQHTRGTEPCGAGPGDGGRNGAGGSLTKWLEFLISSTELEQPYTCDAFEFLRRQTPL